jgi:DUF971 family protein
MAPIPNNVVLKSQSGVLQLVYASGDSYELSFEYLRTHSSSAEVQGHGGQQQILQIGKENVALQRIEPVGNYALRLIFDDGHDSGLFTWDWLYGLCQNQAANWQTYLARLDGIGYERKPTRFPPPSRNP